MRNIAFIIFLLTFSIGCSQNETSNQEEISNQNSTPNPLLTTDIEAQEKWVDSIYNGMSLKERVGQLFMVQAFSNMGFKHENEISALITKHNIGGIIYSKGDHHAKYNSIIICNRFQKYHCLLVWMQNGV